MLSISDITNIVAPFFHTQPVAKAWLFGSYSRGEATTNSDIDIMVRYDESDSMSLLTIAHIIGALEKLTGHKVDLVEDGCLTPSAAATAYDDRILIYERAN